MAKQIKAGELREIILKEYPEIQINILYNPEQDYKGNIIYTKSAITINCLDEDLYNKVKNFIIDKGWLILIGDKALANSPLDVDLYEGSYSMILKGSE
ncbi:hypothetical protein LCGC14_1510080 [marine sediment metagenome]|uniref:Uncharacterized protein n=1 Tax=marine sediment metagenome TaxID=412755 RepID=A0A0F9J1Q5_9ZZZZ